MAVEMQLAKLIVSMMGEDSQLSVTITRMQERMEEAKRTGDKLKDIKIETKGTEAATANVTTLTGAFERLKAVVQSLTAGNIAGAFSSISAGAAAAAGSVGVVVALLAAAAKTAIGMESAATELRSTLAALGLAGAAANLDKFATAMARATTLTKGEVNQLILIGARAGLAGDAIEQLGADSIALSARLGLPAEQIATALARAEAGGEHGLRALAHLSPELLKASREGKNLNDVINRMTREGMQIWEARMQTTAVRISQMRKEVEGLWKAFSKMVEPFTSPALRAVADVIGDIAKAVKILTTNTDGSTQGWLKMAGAINSNAIVNAAKMIHLMIGAVVERLLVVPEVLKIVGNAFVLAFEGIPTLLRWVWETIKAGVAALPSIFVGTIKTILEAFKLMASAIKDMFAGVWEWIKSGGTKGGAAFDFSKTFEELDALQNKSKDIFKELKIPKLDLTGLDPERQKAITDALDKMAAKQAAFRKYWSGEGMPGGKDADRGLGGGKGTVENLESFRNRLQASAATGQTPAQRQEELAKDTRDATRKTNDKLDTVAGILTGMAAGLAMLPRPGTLPP